MTMTVQQAIDAKYQELVMREAAQSNLKGLPARHNALAISGLYDELVNLNIQRIEEGADVVARNLNTREPISC